jgi:hypothetical protein
MNEWVGCDPAERTRSRVAQSVGYDGMGEFMVGESQYRGNGKGDESRNLWRIGKKPKYRA